MCVSEFVTMGSVSSEEGSERCGSYSPSADVSESESSSSFCGRRFDAEGASSSANLSPRPLASHFNFPPPQVMLPVIGGKDVVVWDHKRDLDLSGIHFSLPYNYENCFTFSIQLRECECERVLHFAEVEMMKERFAKLLLGEDMSGGGKGVCTALAISNAITNLSG